MQAEHGHEYTYNDKHEQNLHDMLNKSVDKETLDQIIQDRITKRAEDMVRKYNN